MPGVHDQLQVSGLRLDLSVRHMRACNAQHLRLLCAQAGAHQVRAHGAQAGQCGRLQRAVMADSAGKIRSLPLAALGAALLKAATHQPGV